jgi:ABC-2 type transport system permease protein
MNPALTIARKEYSLSLRSVTTYIIFGLFLLAVGIFFANTAFKVGRAEMRGTFSTIHLIFVVYAPAITMGSIAKEQASGTFELLSTLPIKLSHIVGGKILAGIMQLVTVLLFTLVYLGLLLHFGIGVDLGATFTGYLGLLLAGSAYISIGVFASSLTQNQVLAFIIGLAISAGFYLVKFFTVLVPPKLANILQFFSFDHHLQNFFKGVIDTRDLIFFIAIILIAKYLAELKLQSRNMMQER